MVLIDGLGHARRLVEIAQVAREIGEVNNAIAIAFEVGVINGVKRTRVGNNRQSASVVLPPTR
jgi:hypothetical protein